jgi:hypothetical protein
VGLFDLFKRGEEPRPQYEDEVLGPMVWSEEEEAWAGEHGGFRYLVAYDRRATPASNLLAYARNVLADPAAFAAAVERAKRDAAAEYPRLAEEIAGLRVETVSFFARQGARGIFVTLAGGKEDRCWRVEFGENGCEGIGFDT